MPANRPLPPHTWKVATFVVAFILFWAAVGVMMVLLLPPEPGWARTQYAGEFDNVDPAIRSWFKGVRSPRGVPCCDIADGHRTTSKQTTRTQAEINAGMSEWWVPIEGEWIQVPEHAVVYNAGNPIGEAVVWYIRQGTPTPILIRCFVPGGGV